MVATPTPPENPTIGGLLPPVGVVPNFTGPHPAHVGLKALIGMLTFLTTSTTLIRLYTSLCIIKKVGWSDCLQVASAMSMQSGGGVHQWDVPAVKLTPYAQESFAIELIYCMTFPLVRLSICLQFISIFVPFRDNKFWTILGIVLANVLFYIAGFFVSLLQCIPLKKTWDPAQPGKCISYKLLIVTSAVFNMLSDLLMLILPLVWISRLHMSFKRKRGVSAMFLLGSLSVIASALRLVFTVVYYKSQDQTFTLAQTGACTAAEMTAGVLVGNSLYFPQFYKEVRHRLGPYLTRYSRIASSRKSESQSVVLPITSGHHLTCASVPPSSWHMCNSADGIPKEWIQLHDQPSKIGGSASH
ncbi:MAG: hypothetical protein M1820_005287 [Bogoriella megaspora]|nr:MAG: hypothetical protein M1820_005287 [Bogoriella megaspora]